MSTLRLILPLLVLSVALPLTAQTPTAEQVLTKAKTQATDQKKKIFLLFDASW